MRLTDTLATALTAIRTNRLRSILTLIGIIAGVASIIAVMTGISVVQSAMEREMSVLGGQTFQVQKWPAGGFNTAEQRRKAMLRPPLTLANAQAIREQVKSVDLVGSELWDFGYTVTANGVSTNPNAVICGGTPEYSINNTHFIASGRNLSEMDVRGARNVVVIGPGVAAKLFPFADPLDHWVRIDGHKYQVVGVFDEKKSAFGGRFDMYVLMPVSTFVRTYGLVDRNGFSRSVNITVRAKTPDLVPNAIEDTRRVLRHVRGLRPKDEDNFEFFNSESLITQFNNMSRGIKIGAFVIGTVALIVAGIGIMNIMLVAVTERTREIGIRKALGARPKSILLQFLLEAVALCNVGGVIGVMVGFGLGNLVVLFTHFDAKVPLEWAVIGLVFCSAVGVAFGMLPAMRAASLDPIDALRYE